MERKSIREQLLELLSKNLGQYVTSNEIGKVVEGIDWGRQLRTLRSEGYDISEYSHEYKGYVLRSLDKVVSNRIRGAISSKLRYEVLHRDNSRCQRCGATPSDGAKLHVDHKVPVDWSGTSSLENLWTLCETCNLGKKNLFSDFSSQIMSEIMMEPSAGKRIKRYFELKKGQPVEPRELEIVSGIRDWTRTLRMVRKEHNMDISWVRKEKGFPDGYYIYD